MKYFLLFLPLVFVPEQETNFTLKQQAAHISIEFVGLLEKWGEKIYHDDVTSEKVVEELLALTFLDDINNTDGISVYNFLECHYTEDYEADKATQPAYENMPFTYFLSCIEDRFYEMKGRKEKVPYVVKAVTLLTDIHKSISFIDDNFYKVPISINVLGKKQYDLFLYLYHENGLVRIQTIANYEQDLSGNPMTKPLTTISWRKLQLANNFFSKHRFKDALLLYSEVLEADSTRTAAYERIERCKGNIRDATKIEEELETARILYKTGKFKNQLKSFAIFNKYEETGVLEANDYYYMALTLYLMTDKNVEPFEEYKYLNKTGRCRKSLYLANDAAIRGSQQAHDWFLRRGSKECK